jgi:type IV pilus assembly protein PilV
MKLTFKRPSARRAPARRARDKRGQGGMMLLEALMGILIFSIGILALIAMQARSINVLADAQYRIEAVNLSNRLLSQMWVNADRSNAAALQTSLLNFAHQATGSPADCNFSGDAAASNIVTNWADLINDATNGGAKPLLPGANASMQQVLVDTGNSNRVIITLCWRAPSDTEMHRHTVVGYIN